MFRGLFEIAKNSRDSSSAFRHSSPNIPARSFIFISGKTSKSAANTLHPGALAATIKPPRASYKHITLSLLSFAHPQFPPCPVTATIRTIASRPDVSRDESDNFLALLPRWNQSGAGECCRLSGLVSSIFSPFLDSFPVPLTTTRNIMGRLRFNEARCL